MAILKDERAVAEDTAIRLGPFFRMSAEFCMNLQMTYDLREVVVERNRREIH